MANNRNVQFFYTPHNKSTLIDCNFIVDSTNGNGLGIRSLKSAGRVANVYMHTSATPAAGNPNPAAGLIVVQMADNYAKYIGGFSGFAGPFSGSNISTGLTVGDAYVITVVGTTSTADWVATGLLSGITPAVGVSFIASATSIPSGTGKVQALTGTGAGVDHVELVGNPTLMNNGNGVVLGQGTGMQLIAACYKNAVLTAPANGTIIGMNFYFNDSSFGV